MNKFLRDYQILLSAIILGVSLILAAWRMSLNGRYVFQQYHHDKDGSSEEIVSILDTFTGRRAIRRNAVTVSVSQDFYTRNYGKGIEDLFHEKPCEQNECGTLRDYLNKHSQQPLKGNP